MQNSGNLEGVRDAMGSRLRHHAGTTLDIDDLGTPAIAADDLEQMLGGLDEND